MRFPGRLRLEFIFQLQALDLRWMATIIYYTVHYYEIVTRYFCLYMDMDLNKHTNICVCYSTNCAQSPVLITIVVMQVCGFMRSGFLILWLL